MKLIIKRDQKAQTGFFGGHKGMTFTLSFQVELAPSEQQLISKYKVEDLILLDYNQMAECFGKVQDLKIADLVRGTSYEVNQVGKLIEGEDLVKGVCHTFKTYLEVMASFGGQEVIDF